MIVCERRQETESKRVDRSVYVEEKFSIRVCQVFFFSRSAIACRSLRLNSILSAVHIRPNSISNRSCVTSQRCRAISVTPASRNRDIFPKYIKCRPSLPPLFPLQIPNGRGLIGSAIFAAVCIRYSHRRVSERCREECLIDSTEENEEIPPRRSTALRDGRLGKDERRSFLFVVYIPYSPGFSVKTTDVLGLPCSFAHW